MKFFLCSVSFIAATLMLLFVQSRLKFNRASTMVLTIVLSMFWLANFICMVAMSAYLPTN